MRRREFIAGLGGSAAWPVVAHAQQAEKVRRVGFPSAGSPLPKVHAVFTDALRELGWIEGKNVSFEDRYAENQLDRLPQLAAELVRLNVDVIATGGTLAPLAAKRATPTIPIIIVSASDPLGTGLVASLARPGGNVTGLSLMGSDLAGKRLELLKEVLPGLSRVAVLWNAANAGASLILKETESVAQLMGIKIQPLEVRSPDDLDSALEAAMRQNASALITVEDPLTFDHRRQIADFAAKNRLPALYGLSEYVAAGGLIAYGADISDLYRRGAGYVDKILRGAKPSDLPVEQPTRFQLIINLKAAKALGLTIPETLLATADRVIE